MSSVASDTLRVAALSVDLAAVDIFTGNSGDVVCTASGSQPDSLEWLNEAGNVITGTTSGVNSERAVKGVFNGQEQIITLTLVNGQDDHVYTCKGVWDTYEVEHTTSVTIVGGYI